MTAVTAGASARCRLNRRGGVRTDMEYQKVVSEQRHPFTLHQRSRQKNKATPSEDTWQVVEDPGAS